MVAVTTLRQGDEITIYCGGRKLTLHWRDLKVYQGARASRGKALPRGLQKVDRIEVCHNERQLTITSAGGDL